MMYKEIQYFERDGVPRVQEKVYRKQGDERPVAVADSMQKGDVPLSAAAYEKLQDALVDSYEVSSPGVILAGLHFDRAVKRANKIRADKTKKPVKKRAVSKKRTASKE